MFLGKKVKLPWDVCVRCGLIYLRNDATRRAVKLGCNYKERE